MAQAIRSPRYRGRTKAAGQHITRSDLLVHPRHFRGRHHAATIFVVIVLAVVGFRLFPEQDVTVVHDGQSYRVSAMFQPRTEALAAADVALRPGDRVLAGTGGGTTSFAVQRARPIRVSVDGEVKELNTLATTVGGALADMGVELNPADRVFIGDRLTTPRGPLLSAGFVSREGASVSAASSGTPITVKVRRAQPMTLVTDSESVTLASAADNVQEFLADQGLTVRELDLVQPALDSPLPRDGIVRLKSALSVPVWLDGKEQVLYTQAKTVADIVAVMGLTLGGDDTVEPALDTRVSSNTSVVIRRTRVVDETEEEAIAPRTVEELDISLARGQSSFIEGTPGLKLKTMRVTYKNGEKVASVEVSSKVVREPIPTRRFVGGKGPSAAAAPGPSSSGGLTLPAGRKMLVTATWYDASHGAWSRDDPNYGTTYSGIKLKKGICAVDRSVIPLYTRIWVPGYGECLAADTGSGINGPHIDVGFDEADPDRSSWGVRDIEITILD